jgi:hypothetical protein
MAGEAVKPLRPVIEDGLAVICGDCRQPFNWVGRDKVCGCNHIVDATEKVGRRKCSHKGAKAKGDAGEREAVKLFEGAGWSAYRTPGSGAHGSRNNESAFDTDVVAKKDNIRLKIECKRKASIAGLKSLLKDKARSDVLYMRQDFEEPYVLLPAKLFGELLK